MSARRLPDGGRIDRAEVLRFTWDGAELTGHPGDTLASALLAGGVQLIGRSFKYHRPRGVMSAGVEESGALVAVDLPQEGEEAEQDSEQGHADANQGDEEACEIEVHCLLLPSGPM